MRFQVIVGQVELYHQMQHLLGQRGTDIDELNLIKLWVPMKQESGYSDERSVNTSITEH